ncbi:PAS domain S-box protein [Puteibacter caeruleilacunae]|nr:PAS domain S-box protein [Puteibacter caeruleilacunae]
MNVQKQLDILQTKVDELEEKNAKLQEEKFFLQVENSDLQTDKQKYQFIADFAHDWEFWLNPEGDFIYMSPSCKNITGHTAEEFMQDKNLIYNILYPQDEEQYRQFIYNTLNFINIGKSLEFRILTRTKQLKWCELNCKAVYNSDGKYLGHRGSIRDISRLMMALGQIKNLTDSKQWETKAKVKYKEDLESKDRELVSSLLIISQKNELIQYIHKNLKVILNTTPSHLQPKIKDILSAIEIDFNAQKSWDAFKLHFEKLYPGFFDRISQKFPTLTVKDKKLCAYLRLNLSTKEIAHLMNITPKSAEISRIRLRKKLNLSRETRLSDFISTI